MSWKRAVAAGNKQKVINDRPNRRHAGHKPNKCAAPGCNHNPKKEVNEYWVCNDHGCQTWATLA